MLLFVFVLLPKNFISTKHNISYLKILTLRKEDGMLQEPIFFVQISFVDLVPISGGIPSVSATELAFATSCQK